MATWASDAVESLRRLLLVEKLSASQIGQRLGLTRNAVLGKVHRLGIGTGGPKPASTPRFEPTPRAHARTRIETLAPTMTKKDEATAPPFLAVRFADLGPRACRYACETEFHAPHTFCGQPVREGSAYCPYHHALCRAPTAPPRFNERHLNFLRAR